MRRPGPARPMRDLRCLLPGEPLRQNDAGPDPRTGPCPAGTHSAPHSGGISRCVPEHPGPVLRRGRRSLRRDLPLPSGCLLLEQAEGCRPLLRSPGLHPAGPLRGGHYTDLLRGPFPPVPPHRGGRRLRFDHPGFWFLRPQGRGASGSLRQDLHARGRGSGFLPEAGFFPGVPGSSGQRRTEGQTCKVRSPLGA